MGAFLDFLRPSSWDKKEPKQQTPEMHTYVVLYFGRGGELHEYFVESTSLQAAEAAFNEYQKEVVFDVYRQTK